MAWAIKETDSQWDGFRYDSSLHKDGSAVALFLRCGVVKARTHKLAGKVLDALYDEFHVTAV